MLKSTVKSALVVALLLAGVSRAAGSEAQLLGVLKSDANRQQKAAACRQLARVATKASVPTLAALLGDDELAHMARYALETIPDPSVDEALRAALGKLTGLRQVGVIGSIGVRRDAKAVGALAALLGSADVDVARAAGRALGKIGTLDAANAIEAALGKAPATTQRALYEGLFRCAEALAAKDQAKEAMAIYDRARAATKAPHQVRTAALRGAILTRGKDGIPLLLEALRGTDYVLVAAAARTAMELSAPEVTPALAAELAKLPPSKQILLTQVLGNRRDAAAVPALIALAKKGDKDARIAAIRALPEIGDASAAPVLIGLLGDADVAEAAQAAMAGLEGPKVDAAIAAMLKSADPNARRIAIEQIGQRRSAGAIPTLIEATEDKDEAIRVASLKLLGDVAGLKEFPAIVGLLVKAKTAAEMRAAERALSGMCSRLAEPASGKVVIRKAVYGDLPDGKKADVTRKVAAMVKRGALKIEASNGNFGDPAQGTPKKMTIDFTADGIAMTKTCGESDSITLAAGMTPAACIDALCAALPKASAKPQLALLRILRSAGGPKALAAVLAATKDKDADVANAAISLLCDWPGVEALPAITELAKATQSPRDRILAVRGCLRLIPMQAASDAQKLAALKDAMALITRDDERKLAVSALAAIPAVEALALVTPHLDSPGLKEEACLAAVAIGEKIVGRHAAEVAEAMQRVSKATKNMNTARQARALLAQAKKAAPRK